MISMTCANNQWPYDSFWGAVRAEMYDASQDIGGLPPEEYERVTLACWLNVAVPAGNA
jgi:hypothetical protein